MPPRHGDSSALGNVGKMFQVVWSMGALSIHTTNMVGCVTASFVFCLTWGQHKPRSIRRENLHFRRVLNSWLRDEACWLWNYSRCGRTSMRLLARRNPSIRIRIAVTGWRDRLCHQEMRLGCDGLIMGMMGESQDHGMEPMISSTGY